jgi:hypothetical protein
MILSLSLVRETARLLSTAAAVGPRDDLQNVAVGVVPVDAAPAIVVVDAARLLVRRVRPVRQPPRLDALEDAVELFFADEEGVVLDREVLVGEDVGQRASRLTIPSEPTPRRKMPVSRRPGMRQPLPPWPLRAT